ncbi:MAG: reactive intermediate/imine deaminase [Myxococcales bacterium]|nr:reactive intermediate/imine deaminase [Myxococcales bacterium]|tara:strand:+ start:90 stop:476 length:387 start_codon:yes stop_codon:yes gene_type:complete
MKAIQTEKAPAAIGPYSQAISVTGGAMTFLSGQIALDPQTGSMVEGDVATQTHQVMRNLEAVLAAADLGFPNVVFTTIFLSDLEDFAAVNAVYASYFPENAPNPARATVEVARLPKDATVEISCIAVR